MNNNHLPGIVCVTRGYRVGFMFTAVLFAAMWILFFESVGTPPYRDNDFAHFYLTAKLASDGQNPYGQNLGALYGEYGFQPSRIFIARATNPPGLISCTLFLSRVEPKTAYFLWASIQVAAIFLSLILTCRIFNLSFRPITVAILITVTMASHPVFQLIRYGQAQGLLLLLVVSGLALLKKSPRGTAGMAGVFLWGMAAGIKIFPLPLLYVAARYGGVRAVIPFAGGLLLPQMPFLILAGAPAFADFFSMAVPYIGQTAVTYLGNISVPASLTFSHVIVSGRVDAVPRLFRYASFAAALALILLLAMDCRRPRDVDRSFSGAILGILLFSPTVWANYLIFAFPPIACLVGRVQQGRAIRPALTAALLSYALVGCSPGWIRAGHAALQFASVWTAAVGVLIAGTAMYRSKPQC